MTEIGLSILSSDFSNLGAAVRKYEKFIDFIHMDIMDGNFVPNLTFGTPVVASLRKMTKLLFEAHLMVINPQKQWRWFSPDCERIIFHADAVGNPLALIKKIKAKEKGISINPSTGVAKAEKLVEFSDVLLLMAVPPGFAGQKFDEGVLRKIEHFRKFIDRFGFGCRISVDGGINGVTARRCVSAGADIIITSSWLSSGSVREKAKLIKSF